MANVDLMIAMILALDLQPLLVDQLQFTSTVT